jgi:hypothetical protein
MKFPIGSTVEVINNVIAGQGYEFIGRQGKVVGHDHDDVKVDLDGPILCFKEEELQKVIMKTEFASVAEAVAYYYREGYKTVDVRIMQKGESFIRIHQRGLLDVVVTEQ